MTHSTLHPASEVLRNSGIIAHQTDTVIGLACLPHVRTINRLQKLKLRSASKGFILLASSITQLTNYIQANEKELETISTVRPTPTTWLVDPNNNVPADLLGTSEKIAVRITNHPEVKALCDLVGAIVSTSANLSKQEICVDLNQVRSMFGPNIDFIQHNSTIGSGQSSTIIELSSGKVLRN